MMNIGLKYVTLIGSLSVVFVNFIACGAQMYKVSMKDDMDHSTLADAVSDPNSPIFGLHAPSGWTSLPIAYKVDPKMDTDQKRGLMLAMATWEMAVGKKLFVFEGSHTNVSGDTFPDLYSSLTDAINGHYLDNNWAKTAKPVQVLATTIWQNPSGNSSSIDSADIRFNAQYYKIGNSYELTVTDDREVVDMQSLSLHELGHLLGLAHISEDFDRYSIMNPALYIGEGLASRVPSEDDVRRVQNIYGCEGSACDITATHKKIEQAVKTSEDTDALKQKSVNKTGETKA